VKVTAPASLSRPISVISSPDQALVRGRLDNADREASRAFLRTNSTSAISSITGSVSGIMMKEVMPPAAAALPAEAMFRDARRPLTGEDARIDQPGTATRLVQSRTGATWHALRSARPCLPLRSCRRG